MTGETTTIVILGATGDLAQRKLVPALFNLRCKGRIPENLRIVGFSRSPHSDEQFREFMWQGVRGFGEPAVRQDEWAMFAQSLFYVAGDLGKTEDMVRLKERLRELEDGASPANCLFFLSIAPQLYEPAIKNLGASGLAQGDTGWRRVVIEKPFGRDLASAQALNRVAHQVFDEGQIYRIDHYLGKETVQNLMVFRFANAIFEPLWNRNYVDSVQITVAEEVSVGDRVGYYDQAGVVRDMVQNHLLQLLTLVAMEPPNVADAESLRNKKVEVLKAIRRWTVEEATDHAIRGQYRGYLDEKGVSPDSNTATYAALRLYIDNWRWNGVPFYLRTGKDMAEKTSEIVVQFQCPPHTMFALPQGQEIDSNALALCLQPDEGVHLKFQVKVPGPGNGHALNGHGVPLQVRVQGPVNPRGLRAPAPGRPGGGCRPLHPQRPHRRGMAHRRPLTHRLGKNARLRPYTPMSLALGVPRPPTPSLPRTDARGCRCAADMDRSATGLHILPGPGEAALAMAEFVVALAEERVEADGRLTIALSGGSTPRRLYELLASPPCIESVA